MADGYARLSGKVAICSIASIGLLSAMTQLVNSYKDRIPLVLIVAAASQSLVGADGAQDYDHQETMLGPITRYYRQAQTADTLHAVLRRAMRFAATASGGPVFVSIFDNELHVQSSATIVDRALFDVPARVRADPDGIERVARLLIEARNPLFSVGDEVTAVGGERDIVELSELVGLPVAGGDEFGAWSKPFPTRHPLYLDPVLEEMRFPASPDLRVNIGSPFGDVRTADSTLVSTRHDPTSLASDGGVDVALVYDRRLAAIDLIATIRSLATAQRLQRVAADRALRVHNYTRGIAADYVQILAGLPASEDGPAHLERRGAFLEAGLDPDTIYVADVDSGNKTHPFLQFAGANKRFVATAPNVLGWSMSAAAGAKLAHPDNPVIAVLGDGAFLFVGPTPLWSKARNRIPATNIVLNNRSYNNNHGLHPILSFREGRDAWRYQVYDMIECGAQLTPAEVEIVAGYLASSFGPRVPLEQPARGPGQSAASQQPRVVLARGAGSGLVSGECGFCHGLNRVVAGRCMPAEWDAIVHRMIELGATLGGDNEQQVETYLSSHYGMSPQR